MRLQLKQELNYEPVITQPCIVSGEGAPTPVLLPGKSHGRRSPAKSRTRLSDFTFTFMHWRRKRQPTPVFLPGESQGRGAW